MKKVVLITGGGRGIGKAIAIAFAKKAYQVIIMSRTKEELDATAKEIGLECKTFVNDVCYLHDTNWVFNRIMNTYGRIDVLINCAGVAGPIGALEDVDIGEWENTIDINLVGTVNCTKLAIPIMKKQGNGSIINFCGGGVGGDNIKPNLSAYITSKFAVAGFTEAISKELADTDIKINAISPGAVDTQMAKLHGVKGDTPEKVVGLALFLAETDNNISGKLISAKWDDYENLDTTYYNLRRTTNETRELEIEADQENDEHLNDVMHIG